MKDKFVIEIAWNKKGSSKSERNRILKEKIKKKLKSTGRNIKITALDMGKSVSRKAYETGREIKGEQEKRGGFYNLSRKPKAKPKHKRKVVYVYKYKRHRHRPKVKRIKQSRIKRSYNPSNPFGLSI